MAIVAAEKFADGELNWEDIKRVRKEVSLNRRKLGKTDLREEQEAVIAALLLALDKDALNALNCNQQARFAFGRASRPDWSTGHDGEELQQLAIAYEIFPNPFRPAGVNGSWRTPTVTSLAQAIYDERLLDNHRMGVLADALEDAGCDNADILGHLRGGGDHVRGCWPVDLVLGKE